MNILHVNTFDIAGGAEKIAWTLHQEYLRRGHRSELLVGHKHSRDAASRELPDEAYRHRWARFWRRQSARLAKSNPSQQWLGRALHYLAEPARWLAVRSGREDMAFPVSHHLLDIASFQPDMVHCHNLHGNYFDLRALPALSSRVPVILSLHDAWLFSGHCAHSFACERWKTGCGDCPDLAIDPAIPHDATAANWRRKYQVFVQSRVHIVTPSVWLMRRAEQSLLAPAIASSRVIPHGIDLGVFHPADKQAVRARLGVSESASVLLFAANSIRQNRWKDYRTMRAAIVRVAEQVDDTRQILFWAIGDTPHTERIDNVEIRSIAYQHDPARLAEYYQAADMYLHAANVEVWGLTVTEAMACGTPVIATAVGGILEQIIDDQTGVLIPVGDSDAMAVAILRLMENLDLRRSMGAQAAMFARERFNSERMAEQYLQWYQDIQDSNSTDCP